MNREQRQKLHELLPSVDLVWLLRALVVSVMTVKDLAQFLRYAVFKYRDFECRDFESRVFQYGVHSQAAVSDTRKSRGEFFDSH